MPRAGSLAKLADLPGPDGYRERSLLCPLDLEPLEGPQIPGRSNGATSKLLMSRSSVSRTPLRSKPGRPKRKA